MLKTIVLLLLILAILPGVADTVQPEPSAACTAYCQSGGLNTVDSAQICYLSGDNAMTAALTQHCLNHPTANLPVPLPEDLQQRLLAGEVDNPFRAQYPVAYGITTPTFDQDTLSGLQALPLQLDDNEQSEEWLVYQKSAEEASPPYFWVIQFQGQGVYHIVLEHSGQMFWVEPDKAENYHKLRTARFATLDPDGRTGSFTDVREWEFTNGFYSLLNTSAMAAGSVEKPEPMM